MVQFALEAPTWHVNSTCQHSIKQQQQQQQSMANNTTF
jgi:hypothetical protein